MNREPLPDAELDALLAAAHAELVDHHTAEHARPNAVTGISMPHPPSMPIDNDRSILLSLLRGIGAGARRSQRVRQGFSILAAAAASFIIATSTILVKSTMYVPTTNTGSTVSPGLMVTVFNKVTNGSTHMRAKTPPPLTCPPWPRTAAS